MCHLAKFSCFGDLVHMICVSLVQGILICSATCEVKFLNLWRTPHKNPNRFLHEYEDHSIWSTYLVSASLFESVAGYCNNYSV